jgi:hypothetical protein
MARRSNRRGSGAPWEGASRHKGSECRDVNVSRHNKIGRETAAYFHLEDDQ